MDIEQSSIKRNYVYNLISTITTLLFPLVTFPYASRILLADGIGQVAFFKSIISYIIICSSLGLPLYAVREIARVRNDAIARSRVAIEIVILHSLLSLLGYILVAILCVTVQKIRLDIPLFLLLSSSIFLNAIGAIWFYQGIEDFKYITIRGIIVRVVSVLMLFIFVKSKSDLMYYAAIHVVAEGGANVFNFFRLRRFITFRKADLQQLNIIRHIKPALKTFALNITASIYLYLDSVMLGFLSTEKAVGFYTASNSIVRVSMTVIISLGNVMLPRLSHLAALKQTEEFKNLTNKMIHFGLMTGLPMAVGLLLLSTPVFILFCGENFIPSILTAQIMSPMMIVVTLSCFLVPMLYAVNRETIPVYSTLTGALINVLLNFLLIPQYAQYGAATATVIAEICVAISMFVFGRKYVSIHISVTNLRNYIVGTILMALIITGIICTIQMNNVMTILVCIPCGVLVYCGYLYLRRDTLVIEFLDVIRTKLNFTIK